MHVSGKSVHRQQVGKYGIEIMQKRLDQRFFFKWNMELYFWEKGINNFWRRTLLGDTEAATRDVPLEKVLLEILKNPQEDTCARVSFLTKLPQSVTLVKKRLWHRCFPVNFAKFLSNTFFSEYL